MYERGKKVSMYGRERVLQFAHHKPISLALGMPYLHPNPIAIHVARAAGLLKAIFGQNDQSLKPYVVGPSIHPLQTEPRTLEMHSKGPHFSVGHS